MAGSCGRFIKFAKHCAVQSYHLLALISLTVWGCIQMCIHTYLPVLFEKDCFALLMVHMRYTTLHFLSVYGLNSTYAFPFNSNSVSTSNQNNTYVMLKACTLCMVLSCTSWFPAGLTIIPVTFFPAFNMYWMITLRWRLKTWDEQSCLLFLYVLVLTLRLYHIWGSPLQWCFQGEGEESPNLTFLLPCPALQHTSRRFGQMSLHQLYYLLFSLLGTC